MLYEVNFFWVCAYWWRPALGSLSVSPALGLQTQGCVPFLLLLLLLLLFYVSAKDLNSALHSTN